jgi:hypothetical protein
MRHLIGGSFRADSITATRTPNSTEASAKSFASGSSSEHSRRLSCGSHRSHLMACSVTIAGKARVSQNATKLGFISVANFVRPEERDIFK